MLGVLISLLLLGERCLGVGEDAVVEYSDQDFDTNMVDHDTALVMFYAPWCGHCKHLKPEFAKAAVDLSRHEPPITLVKVDCTQSGKSTCDKYEVDGYPTLKVFRSGVFAQDYKGPRTSEGIVEFMEIQAGPKFKRLLGNEEVEDFTNGGGGGGGEEDVHVVGYFDAGTEFEGEFFKVAEQLWVRVRFGYCSECEREVLEKLVLYRPTLYRNKFEKDLVIYDGDADSDQMKHFILTNYHGLVGHRTYDNKDEFPVPLVVAYYRLDYKKNPKGTKYWRNRVLKVAQHYRDKANFAVSPKEDFHEELNEYGVDNWESPRPTILARNSDRKKYLMEDPFSCENLTKFVDSLLEDKLESRMRAGSVSPSVKVAVAKNFDRVVKNNGRDTVLALYNPWCNRCRALAPVYEEFAKKLDDEEVDVVRMDAIANDLPEGFRVDSYPTVYWLMKEKKNEPILYEGKKELDEILKYVAMHATEELKGYDREGNEKDVFKEQKTEKVEL